MYTLRSFRGPKNFSRNLKDFETLFALTKLAQHFPNTTRAFRVEHKACTKSTYISVFSEYWHVLSLIQKAVLFRCSNIKRELMLLMRHGFHCGDCRSNIRKIEKKVVLVMHDVCAEKGSKKKKKKNRRDFYRYRNIHGSPESDDKVHQWRRGICVLELVCICERSSK